jgi:outer membrane cobalamin receptor
LLSLLLLVNKIHAQSTIKLYGRVVDEQTQKPLWGANIIVEGTTFGAATNSQGYYQIENLMAGFYIIKTSFMGYQTHTINNVRIPVDQPFQLNFSLKPLILTMPVIEITEAANRTSSGLAIIEIKKEDFAHKNYSFVGDLLQEIPGVEIQNSGGTGQQKKISIRGSETNQVLVLLDGVPLNDEHTGSVNLTTIPVHLIEKIEVHKGGNSSRFGSGAIGGVVNLITHQKFPLQLHLDAGTGSFHHHQLEGTFSSRIKNLSYLISGNFIKNQGDYPYSYIDSKSQIIHENRLNADFLSQNFFSRINYEFANQTISSQIQYLKSERGLPGKIDAWTPYARTNNQQRILGLDYKTGSRILNFIANYRYSISNTENVNHLPADAPRKFRRYPAYHYTNDLTNSILMSSLDYIPIDWFSQTVGFTWRFLKFQEKNLLSITNPAIQEANDEARAIFLSQELKREFAAIKSQFTVNPAIRYDWMILKSQQQKRIEKQWSPGVGGFLKIGQKQHLFLKANYARSFRVPTFADLFYQDARVQGKPDLLPEKGENIEFGTGGEMTVMNFSMHLEINRFQNNITNLIVWRLGSFEIFQPFNTDAQIRGTEYSLQLQTPEEWLKLNLGFTELEPFNKNPNVTTWNKIIPYRPRQSFKGGMTLKYHQGQAHLLYRKVGRRFINEANTHAMPPYSVWDGHFSWIFKIKQLEITAKFSILNLTNEEYEIIRDMPLPLREWRMGLDLKF